MLPTLTSRSSALPNRVIDLPEAEARIGRDPTNDIVVEAASVSRFHASVSHDGAGHVITDLGSKNGTWINDRRIDAPATLADGDTVRFGDIEFVYSSPDLATRTIARPADATHETVTFLFADLVGHTPIFEALGSDEAYRVISGRVAVMMAAVSELGGRTFKTEGDGIAASFRTVGAAVDAAIAIQRSFAELTEPGPPVRIGINSGEAVKHGDDFIGLAVNKAARVMSLAAAGEILVSDVSRALLAPTTGLHITARGWFELKGFPRKERIFEVAWAG